MPSSPVVTNFHSLLKFMSIELMMLSNHLILCCPLLVLPSIFPRFWVCSNESALLIRWPKYWSFSVSPSNEYSELISFRIDWFDLLRVQGTIRSLLQHLSSKASTLQCSVFFMVQLSHPYLCHPYLYLYLYLYLSIHPSHIQNYGKTIALTIRTSVDKMMSLLFNMLSRFVIAFLSRSKSLLISRLQSLSGVILEPKKIKSVTASTFSPSICHVVMGPDAMILVVFNVECPASFLSPSFFFLPFLSPLSRNSLVPLHFLPLEGYHLHI